MFLSAVTPFLLFPFVAAAGVHKFKLKKFDTAPISPSLESAYLAEKYGAQVPAQLPLLGSGGQGRRLSSRPGDDLYWTQEEFLDGGYKHPLSSALPPLSSSIRPLT
jgi:saccharopepsin